MSVLVMTAVSVVISVAVSASIVSRSSAVIAAAFVVTLASVVWAVFVVAIAVKPGSRSIRCRSGHYHRKHANYDSRQANKLFHC